MNDAPSRQDIVNCYRLALGRDPESEAVIAEKLGQPSAGLLRDFFSSSEFEDGVRRAIVEPSPPQAGFRLPPSLELRTWASRFAPLSQPGVQAVQAAESWPGLYRALFADAVFCADVLTEAARAASPAFLSALAVREQIETASRIEGRIELVTPHEIRGWALDRGEPHRRLSLELWVEGVFRAAIVPDRYRPELQARFGGGGLFGFALARPPEARGAGPLRAELREARSGAVIEMLQLPALGAPPVDVAVALRRELAEVRALLARIEQRLPDLGEAYSFDLELYGDYFEAYYGAGPGPGPTGAPLSGLCVLLDATAASPAELDGALASVARQTRAPTGVVVAHRGGELRLAFHEALSSWRGHFRGAASLQGVVADRGWAAAMAAAAEAAGQAHLVVLDGRARLAPEAVERMAEALGTGAALVYADSDEVERLADGGLGRHRAPALRTAFDAELFTQQGDLGPLLGLSRPFVDALGWRPERQASGLYDLVLRGLRRPELGGFVHIPRVLSHGLGARPVDVAARRDALQDHLAACGTGAEALAHADVLGATLPSALRIRHRPAASARATVIVPTRDRVDLLEPCLSSLVAAAAHNRTRLDILVVDNQSCEPETFAVFERFARTSPLRVLAHDGGFNWSLMNNRAGMETDAEVLIFLNNDTVVLTPDWCDELCSQALRPEVGAVGARLLYGDGTIQHAGVVCGGGYAFTEHEGVGAPGGDPGYQGRHALMREVSAVTGACIATRRSVFENLGRFDALNLPVEGNDMDYCFRLRAAGLKVLYDPYCTLYHHESKSRGLNLDPAKREQGDQAGRLIRARWGEAYRHDPFYNPHFDRLSPPLARLAPPAASTPRLQQDPFDRAMVEPDPAAPSGATIEP